MGDLSRDNFGLVIAYLLPGFVALWGLAFHSPLVWHWLGATPSDPATVAGFLYAVMVSTALGLFVSAVRWALIDRILAALGIRQPTWDFELFAERIAAYEVLVSNHYCYYQFYANMLVASVFAYASRWVQIERWDRVEYSFALGVVLVVAILFLGAADTLRKYYERTGALLNRDGGRPRVVTDLNAR